jgi:hypothetical protein
MSLEMVNGTLEEEDSDASQPSSPPPSPSRGRIPFFRSPAAEEDLSSTLPPLSPSESGDGSASAGEQPSDPSESPEETGPRASSADGPLKPLGKAALKATTAQAVLIGSAMAHRVAARTEGQRRVGLYIADEEDADNIGGPVASILHRRGGVAGGQLSPDANDALQAIMGLAGYVSKQVVRVQQAREVDGFLAAGGSLDVDPDEAA